MRSLSEGPGHVSRRYGSPIEPGVRVVTGVLIVTVVLGVVLFGFMARPYQVISALFLAFSVVLLVSAYTFRPIGYGMGPDGLIVFFPWRHLKIPWTTVEDVQLEPRESPFRAVRVLGSGGVFGHLGRYWSPALGMHLRLVTDRSRVIVLRRKIPYCLSPDDPDRFVREAREYLGSV